MKFFILMVSFVTTLSATTVTSLYHWYGPSKPTAESVDNVYNLSNVFMSPSHQDHLMRMNKLAAKKS